MIRRPHPEIGGSRARQLQGHQGWLKSQDACYLGLEPIPNKSLRSKTIATFDVPSPEPRPRIRGKPKARMNPNDHRPALTDFWSGDQILRIRENIKHFKDFRTETGSSQGQNLALTGLFVPSSLDGGLPTSGPETRSRNRRRSRSPARGSLGCTPHTACALHI